MFDAVCPADCIGKSAYFMEGQIYIRKNSESLLSDLVYEGNQAIDYNNIVEQTIYQAEFGSYKAEQLFQIEKNLPIDFVNDDEILVHIYTSYENGIFSIPKEKRLIMNIEEKLVDFDKTGNRTLIISEENQVERSQLLTIVRNIIDWLEVEHKRTLWIQEGRKIRLKPMELRMQYPWCRALIKLVDEELLFKEYFCIKGNKFDFCESISEEEKKKIREYVYSNRRRCFMR